MKKVVLFILLILFAKNHKAQLNLQWAKQAGSTGTDRAVSMSVDGSGNVITSGVFTGTVDFDPGSGSFTMTANTSDNMYVCKLDGNGGFLWAKQFLCNTTNAFSRSVDIFTDFSGNIYITGWFRGTVDFNSGSSSYTIASSGMYDAFVCKYSANGNFQWVKKFGGDECVGTSIATDAAGNVFTTGFMYGAVDFDPGTSTYTLSTLGSVEAYISKLDANGNFVWANSITGSSDDFGAGISIDPSGNVVVTGKFRNVVDFDPGSNTYTLSSSSSNTDDIYICKLTNSGTFQWANRIGDVNPDEGIFINTDAQGNIYATGKFNGTVDFDPGPGTYTLNSYSNATYILKLNSAGSFLWAKSVDYSLPHSLALDLSKNVYLTGVFYNLTDFDPGPSSYTLNLPYSASQSSFILKLDSLGSFFWAKQVNLNFFSGVERYGKSICLDAGGNIHLSGFFYGSVDMDFSSSTYTLNSGGVEDIFAAKYCQVPELPGSVSGSTLACTGSVYNFSIAPGNGVTSYSWTLSSGLTGTSSSNSISVVAGTSGGTISVMAMNACGNSISRTLSVTVTPSLNISVTNPTICSAGPATITASGATSYTWSTGANTASISGMHSSTTIYTVVGSSPGCNISTKTATVTVSNLVNVTITASSPTVCAGHTVALIASGAPSYSWSSGATSSSIVITGSASAIMNYTVRGSNGGCSDTKSISVTSYASPVVSGNSISICMGSTFTMTPTGALTYTFSNGSATASPTANTTYSVTGTNSQGCISLYPGLYHVMVNSLPVITVNNGTVCAGKVFSMNPSGANTYTYSSGSSTVIPSTNSSYSISGTSSMGCLSASAAVSSVTVLTLPIISVNSGSICAGNVFTIIANGAPSYSYSGNSSTVSPLSTTNYSVIGIDVLGCESLPVISSVTVHALPLVTVNSGSICIGGTFTMIPGGAISYTFSNGSATVNPSTNATYSVTGTNSLGCISSQALSNVTVHPLPVIAVNNGTVCSGQIFTMIPTGANTYTYSNGSATVIPITNSFFTITGTSAQGCISATPAVSSVTVNVLPIINVSSGSICAGEVFTISPSGASTYSFYSGNTNTVSPLVTSSYSLTGTDTLGCESLLTILTVTVYSVPIVTVNSGSICAGEIFTITPLGAVNYTYSSGSATVSPTTNSSYTVTGTNNFGCISEKAISQVIVNPLPALILSTSAATICSGESATLSAFGALTYTWSSGENLTKLIITPSTSVIYSISGSDINGCVNTFSFTQIVELCLGINPESMSGIKLYPNPNNGEFNIETETETDITLINTLGEIVLQSNFPSGYHQINFQEQTNGMYTLLIKKNNTFSSLKIIKQ